MDDVHARLLRELEHYLAFFKRRHEIEQDYVDSLKKLSLRAAQGDAQLSDELHAHVPTSWRKAWVAMRTCVDDEVRAHTTTADGLDRVVNKLTSFRDDRERSRRRIRDDLRSTASEWSEYKTVVQRLRKSYERKVDELQHHEDAEALREQEHSPAQPGTKGDPGWPPEHWVPDASTLPGNRKRSDSAASAKAGASASDADSPPPSLLSPGLASPVFVSGATSSAAAPSAYRDAPTGKQNVFEAIAKRDWNADKHRVNSIVRAVGSLAKGNDPATALGPARQRSRQYSSKLKREAEQADRDYRSGIFQLETLRLQKIRVQTSARESLREFVLDLASNLKTAFTARVDEQIVLGHAQGAIAEHVKPEIDKINAKQDASDFFNTVQDQSPPDPPVYYVNAFVGECKSLLFGVGLQDYHAKHPHLLVPLIVQRCIANIEATGLDVEGIYRVPGKLATIQQLVHRMEKEEEAFEFGPNDDTPAVAGVLKLYLRQLPTPLFPFAPQDRKAWTADYASSPEAAIASLARRIRRLSPPQQATLKTLCQHLAKVTKFEHVNKMGASNLSLIFTTVIFGEDETATLESAMNGTKDTVMEVLIHHHAELFRDLPLEPASAPRSRQGSDDPTPGVLPSNEPHSSAATFVAGSSSVATTPQRYETPSLETPATATMPATSAPMRTVGSVDSVYALYQHATTPGGLTGDASSPVEASARSPHVSHALTALSAPAPRSPLASTAPQFAPVAEHPLAETVRLEQAASVGPAAEAVKERPQSFGEFEPPLSAAMGRHVPQE
ncbi:hypothetical protein JCM3770_006114 [Rhodotorula araucariae]